MEGVKLSAASKRRRVNIWSGVVTVCVLFVAVALSDGKLATRINEISENLDKALHNVIDSGKDIKYTPIDQHFRGFSDVVFHPQGMDGLYNITNAFINLVVTKNVSLDGIVKVRDNQIIVTPITNSQLQDLLLKYAGPVVICAIILVIGVFMPLCGFCFCCGRCCGSCGARSQPSDKKHDLCKKVVLATLLICLGTVLLFIVVCAFTSNQQLHDGVNELPQNTKHSLNDMKDFMDFTVAQFSTLLTTNYEEFSNNFLDTIDNSSEIVYAELKNYTHAVIMTNITNFANQLDEIKDGFTQIKYSTNSLRVYASQLNDATRQVKKDLLQTLKRCTEAGGIYKTKCDEIMNNITNLHTQIDFNKLPDMSDQIHELESYDNKMQQLSDTIKECNAELLSVEEKLKESLKKNLDQVKDKVKDTKRTIADNFKTVKEKVTQSKDDIEKAKPYVDKLEGYIRDYGKYQYYVGLALSCVLLLISLCIMLGLICGICGKRPDVYGEDCCNKGAGSQFLICGVMIMFLCGFVFAVVVLPFFLVGVVSQRVACDPLKNPTDNSIIEIIDQVLNTSSHGAAFGNLALSSLLQDIRQNKTIYQVFHLETQFDLKKLHDYLDQYNDTLSELPNQLDSTAEFLKKIKLDKIIPNLEQMGDLTLDVGNFDKFQDELNANFTTVNLTLLSNDLNSLIEEINEDIKLRSELMLSKLHIDSYQEKIVNPMTKNATDLIKLCMKLKVDLSDGGGSFKNKVQLLIGDLEYAQTKLNQSRDILMNITLDFAVSMVGRVRTYINRVIDKTQTEIGKTGPFGRAINNTLTSTCDKILLPFNGFWFVLFWSLIVFIPTIIVSVKLSILYQKYSPYSGHLVETRTKPKRKKNKKTKNYDERSVPSGGGDMVSREYPGGSHQDTRYSDMAPKQWEDFPAGGPPQYQRAPTEYERPPPYYYPGSGDHQ